jgi:hypothetical protein
MENKMNYLHDCRQCGGPVYGSWLHSYHKCLPTPYVIVHQVPRAALPDTEPLPAIAIADKITPGEATRLCHKIAEQLAEHCTSCEYCKLVLKLQLRIRLCDDAIALREAIERWEQYTLIEVDRKDKTTL